ncbi:sigma-54-dependent Fis family transcriptional regulator [Pseudonocardia sp. CA-107938]|uniref:sigma-54-dependent Fis family transcriptional regulator n=1 Tax=Pseudonocardia sp. CA-107938 TaxID=3240021 RepID=UPI003D8FADB5
MGTRPDLHGAAWELFQSGQEPHDIRREVLTSWRRSKFSGVDPEYVAVPFLETDLDSHFSRVAVPIMTGMATLLVGDSSCLALADASGSVIWRWVSEPMLRTTLDGLSVIEGFNFGEEFVGTNGLGTALETGGIAVVRGAEHFVHRFHDVTCVAAPVRHPITRRVLGAVNVTCRVNDTNSLLAVIVSKLVDEIQQALYQTATARERTLLSAFLAERRTAAGPLAVVGDDLIITNPQAADLGIDRLGLWDEIRAQRGTADRTQVSLPADLTAEVRLVRTDGKVAGAVVSIHGPAADAAQPARRPRPPRTSAKPHGRTGLQKRAGELAEGGTVAVLGEAGTGKTTVLRAALDPVAVLDAATYGLDPTSWANRLRRHLDAGDAVVLTHVELLDAGAVRTVSAVLAEAARPGPVGLTITVVEGAAVSTATTHLLDALCARTMSIPPLRRAPDEIADAAQDELHRHDPALSFTADALAALRRYSWPGNLAELARIVADLARAADRPRIGTADLPAEVRHAGERRALTPLEAAEATVIASVLREHDGNKSTAARALGISRTALYAKIRTYRI